MWTKEIATKSRVEVCGTTDCQNTQRVFRHERNELADGTHVRRGNLGKKEIGKKCTVNRCAEQIGGMKGNKHKMNK